MNQFIILWYNFRKAYNVLVIHIQFYCNLKLLTFTESLRP